MGASPDVGTDESPSVPASPTQPSDDAKHGSGAASTVAAFCANLGVAVAKFIAWIVTGSASMLAEAVHSVADTGNQGLLLFGRHRSRRGANRRHPFGFGRERYFWAFVVAIVLFSAGSLFALVEGEEKLRQPHELSSFAWAVGVLLIGVVFESVSFRTAVHESRRRKRPDESWRQFVRRTTVPELAVVLLEDAGALCGLALALLGTTLAYVTGNARFDALGSVGIGLLLGAIAFTLAAEMKSMLIGEAANPELVEEICDIIERSPSTVSIDDLRTEQLGPDEILVVGEVRVRVESADDLDGIARRLREQISSALPVARLVYLNVHSASSPSFVGATHQREQPRRRPDV
jgi:cation diffusion facilitator family transporter